MADTRGKYVPPTISETAFSCPHCGALTTQTWYDVCATELDGKTPKPVDAEWIAAIRNENPDAPEANEETRRWLETLAGTRPAISGDAGSVYGSFIGNVAVSKCYNCRELALWVYKKLVWPVQGTAPLPHSDMPPAVRADYEEASQILILSPRGAAALVRLGVQKLCQHLGQKGENINDDIKALVAKGLDGHIIQALDILRVTGNNAVHPGEMDLKDDQGTASALFDMLNLIVEEMIGKPKRVQAIYDKLPAGAREAIAARNAKAIAREPG